MSSKNGEEEKSVYFRLNGSVSINHLTEEVFLAEVSQRAAIIIACHLFYKKKNIYLRPYIATLIHKQIFQAHHSLKQKMLSNQETQSTPPAVTSSFIIKENSQVHDYVVRDINAVWEKDTYGAEGGFNLDIENRYIEITYQFSLCIEFSVWQNVAYSLPVEPHSVWIKLLKKAMMEIDKNNNFSAYIADDAVAKDIKDKPFVLAISYYQDTPTLYKKITAKYLDIL